MKPKILLVKYFDWAVIGVLALVLAVVLVKSFFLTDPTVSELSNAIRRAAQTVRRETQKMRAGEVVKVDYVDKLRDRLNRPPVIPRYPRNPFFPPVPIRLEPIQLVKEETLEKAYKKVFFVEIMQTDKDTINVSWENYDPDDIEQITTLKLEGLKAGSVELTIRDKADQVWVIPVYVRETVTLNPPYPPMLVTIRARAAFEMTDMPRRPARVLISFRHRSPRDITAGQYGITTGARVYRKPAGAPDSDFEPCHDEVLRPISDIEKIRDIWYGFDVRAGLAAEEKGEERPEEKRPRPGEGEVPEVVPDEEFRRRAAGPRGRDERAGAGEMPEVGSYVLLDDTVEEGERYIYKIETISESKDAEPVACRRPYISRRIFVPSLFEILVKSASPRRATLYVRRPDPETGREIEERFVVVAGMRIGGKVRMKRDPGARGVAKRRKDRYKFVDFSTDAVFVDAVIFTNRVDVRVRYGREEGFDYRARLRRDPLVLYRSSRGTVRWKGKEKIEPRRKEPRPGGREGPRSSRGRR